MTTRISITKAGLTKVTIQPGHVIHLRTAIAGPQGPRWSREQVPVTYDSTITVDLTDTDVVDITLAGNPTINFVNGADAQSITLRLKQDAVGGRVVTWGSTVRFGTDIPPSSLVLSTVAGKTDYVALVKHSTDGVYDIVSFVRGF